MNLLVITQLLRTIIINFIQKVYNRLRAHNINPYIYICISTLLSYLVIIFYYYFVLENLNIMSFYGSSFQALLSFDFLYQDLNYIINFFFRWFTSCHSID
jgi:hypothetical protein